MTETTIVVHRMTPVGDGTFQRASVSIDGVSSIYQIERDTLTVGAPSWWVVFGTETEIREGNGYRSQTLPTRRAAIDRLIELHLSDARADAYNAAQAIAAALPYPDLDRVDVAGIGLQVSLMHDQRRDAMIELVLARREKREDSVKLWQSTIKHLSSEIEREGNRLRAIVKGGS